MIRVLPGLAGVRGARGRFLFLALLALGGCAGEEEPGFGDPEEATERPALPGESPRERCAAMQAEGLAVEGRTREALRRELGPPAGTALATEPNRHVSGATDTLHTLRHEGLEIRIRTAGGRDLTERIAVRDARHLRFREPTIGTDGGRLLEFLGEPDLPREEGPAYLCAAGPTANMPLEFDLEDGQVAAIAWEFYVD